jgi:hypothetical protein
VAQRLARKAHHANSAGESLTHEALMTTLLLAPWFLLNSPTPPGPRWPELAALFAVAVHVGLVLTVARAAVRAPSPCQPALPAVSAGRPPCA